MRIRTREYSKNDTMELACEICGKSIYKHELVVKIQTGRKTAGPFKRLFTYWTQASAEAVAHIDCLDLEESDLPEDKEVSWSEICRESAFKLSNYEINEVRD